ncbi:MFS transporter [Paracoccus zhejiangensis]|uniref:MFS transporter n=1 Tax=Paracoccus zhejiangensis TaxID=1077935 RepID=A0A2H5F187_9RHOB|nr:MFS transporter [Paracoccus zhejiangensis]AUH65329.1 MFS transporter [Paracoccus zhejiangensis]
MTALARFIAATGLANFGDGIAIVAWGWIATQLTRDPLLIALVPVALKAPWFVFSLPAGIIVDRFDRRRLILAADTLRALAYAGAGLAIWAALPFDEPPLRGTDRPLIFALVAGAAITVGIAEVLRDNAAQTMLPALVPEHDLERANGRLWSVEFVMNNFVGTAAAGLLLGLSLALPFGVNAAALALSVALVAGLKGDFRAETEAKAPATRNWRAELREGVAYLLGQPILRNLAILTGLFNFSFEAMMVTLVLLVQERLQLGPLAISAIMAAGGAGGVLAGLINHRVVDWLGRSRVLQITMAAAMVFPLTVLFAASGVPGLILICAGFFISEFGGVLWNTVSVSYRQRHIPRRLLGRVNSAYRLFAIGMAPLGMFSAGLLTRGVSESVGRQPALLAPYILGLLIFALTTIVFWRFLGRAFPVEPDDQPR